jgi:hypothetical protein
MLYFTCSLLSTLSSYILGREAMANFADKHKNLDFDNPLRLSLLPIFWWNQWFSIFFSANVISSLPFTTFLQASIGSHFPRYTYYLELLRKFVQSLFHNFFSHDCFNFMFVIWTILGNMKPKFELLLYGTSNSSINQHINHVRMLLSMDILYFFPSQKIKIISKIQITNR